LLPWPRGLARVAGLVAAVAGIVMMFTGT
jgi:hypothetical protein